MSETKVRVVKVRDGGPVADAQWWAVAADNGERHAEAGVQSMGRRFWGVWGHNLETHQSFLDSTHESRELATEAAREYVTSQVEPVSLGTEEVDLSQCVVHTVGEDDRCLVCQELFAPEPSHPLQVVGSDGIARCGDHLVCYPAPAPIATVTWTSSVCAVCGRTAKDGFHLVDDTPLCLVSGTPVCANDDFPSTDGRIRICVLAPGHDGQHANTDGNRWPAEVEVELEDGTTVTVDPDVADQVEAGYSVGEAEDICDHDDGLHDEESVPGCPRCDDLDDDDEPPGFTGSTRAEYVAWATTELGLTASWAAHVAAAHLKLPGPGPDDSGAPCLSCGMVGHVLVNDPNKGVCVCGAITVFDRQAGWRHQEDRKLQAERKLAEHDSVGHPTWVYACPGCVRDKELAWEADLDAHRADCTTEEAMALVGILDGTGSEVMAANYSSDCDCPPEAQEAVESGEAVTCCWDGLQAGDFDDLDPEEAADLGPFQVWGAAGLHALEAIRS